LTTIPRQKLPKWPWFLSGAAIVMFMGGCATALAADPEVFEEAAHQQTATERTTDDAATEEQDRNDRTERESTPTTERPTTTTVLSFLVTTVFDGDTIQLSDGSTIRLIGIDTPESGTGICASAATDRLQALVANKSVTIEPGAREDRDRYGRLLRYVEVGHQDVGAILLREGLAVARYDSRDGYGAHPQEQEYIRADASSPNCSEPAPTTTAPPPPPPTTTPAPAPPPPPTTAPAPAPPPSSPPAAAYYQNCDAARAAGAAPIYAGEAGYRPGLDRDGDGIACE
jgi:endonuclease YncB( thermonuclease family)